MDIQDNHPGQLRPNLGRLLLEAGYYHRRSSVIDFGCSNLRPMDLASFAEVIDKHAIYTRASVYRSDGIANCTSGWQLYVSFASRREVAAFYAEKGSVTEVKV